MPQKPEYDDAGSDPLAVAVPLPAALAAAGDFDLDLKVLAGHGAAALLRPTW